MPSIKNPRDVFLGAVAATLIAILLMMIHVRVNYPPEMRSLVWIKAAASTGIVGFCMSYFVLWQMKKNYHLTQELQRLVNRDRLTDVATRDFFFAQMEQHPNAYGVSLMVDIDHFKMINDRFGHPAGDAVIRAVAAALRTNIRANDIVCRFGGEEFVIFLQEHDQEEGFAVAERMRQQIAQMEVLFREHRLVVTVSIGGSLKEKVKDISWAIQAADDALYRAKNGGRNRTVFDSDKPAVTSLQSGSAGYT